MNLEKLIKYSVPFFVLAIISRAVEEISFIYYAVPVMCVFFIVLLFISSKFNSLSRTGFGIKSQRSNNKDTSTSLSVTNPLASSIQHLPAGRQGPKSEVRNPASGVKQFPSPIFHLPFLLFLLPGLWFLSTSLWSSYPEISAARALYFILISTGCISAGVLWIRYSGKGMFDLLLPANVIVVLICAFSILTNIPSDTWTGGHGKGFIGFFGHQNLLASVLLFTIPAVIVKIKDKSQEIKGRKVFFFILSSALGGLNLIVLALTYSRSAILSFIFGVIVFLILNKKWKVILYGFGAAAVLSMIIYFTPTLNDPVDKILKKDFPEIYSSRIWMWEPSYKAALEGGLFGLGYGISHPEIRSGEYSDRFENGRLIREKGNSTLALIEEAGLIGLILFLIPIFYILFKVIFTKDSLLPTTYSLLSAALAAFLLHSQFEAWWVGVGSVQLPLFFVYLGLIIDQSVRKIG